MMLPVKSKLIFLFALSSIGALTGYFFDNLFYLANCYSNGVYRQGVFCADFFDEFGYPLFLGMSAFSIVFLALFFVPSAFNVWKKFAIFAIPIAFLLFVMAPSSNSGGLGGGVGFGPTDIQTYRWVSVSYVVISLIIIAVAAFRSRGKAKGS